MTKEQERLKSRFLEPETRDGHLVSADVKVVWQKLLELLEEFIRICDKYGLKYCVDGGTLLGAIRHKGFIPWDDDIDVSLFRDDFKRFLEVAPKELRHPFCMQYTTSEPGHYQAFACLRNCETTAIDKTWLEARRVFCMGISIDVFPIDYIPDDPKSLKRELWLNKQFSRIFYYAHGGGCGSVLRNIVLRLIFRTVYLLVGNHRLVALRDWNFGRFKRGQCTRCSNIAFNLGKERAIWDKTIYDTRVKVPFEYLDVYVPVGYETYLAKVYGSNWRTPIKGAGDHDELIVDVNRPYKEVLIERYGYRADALKALP